MKKRKLSTGLIRLILTCWIIPYLLVSSVLLLLYGRHSRQQIGRTVCTAMENAGLITADKIYAAIEMSRQASYDGVIKRSYEQFLRDGDEGAMYREVTDYLNRTYKYSKTISNTILLYVPPVSMEYYTYSNVAGATYSSIDEFKRNADEAVRKAARDLDTRTRLIDIAGHLYVVRNIVRSNYEPFATLVMEVNKDRLFESTDSVIWKKCGIVVLVTLIPLLIASFSYLNRNINQPVRALIRGSEKIRGGAYGFCVEPFDKNEEMGQLVDTFNHMSASLEDSFNRIYVEEIAERDATLKALQSQINPHFLNNTLEIINWKARLRIPARSTRCRWMPLPIRLPSPGSPRLSRTSSPPRPANRSLPTWLRSSGAMWTRPTRWRLFWKPTLNDEGKCMRVYPADIRQAYTEEWKGLPRGQPLHRKEARTCRAGSGIRTRE